MASTDAKRRLTGVWQGRYSYPAKLPPVSFVATLIESGIYLSGSTHEEAASIGAGGYVACASLSGQSTESHVSFTKIYENVPRSEQRPIHYQGSLNAEATEISGTWTIEGVWSGSFVMIRSPGQSAKKIRQRVVSVR